MKGNFHVQFLGEGVAATSPPYPTRGGQPPRSARPGETPWARASCTTWGNSTIPGMSICSILHLRQAKKSQNLLDLPHFYTVS